MRRTATTPCKRRHGGGRGGHWLHEETVTVRRMQRLPSPHLHPCAAAAGAAGGATSLYDTRAGAPTPPTAHLHALLSGPLANRLEPWQAWSWQSVIELRGGNSTDTRLQYIEG